VYTFDFLSPNRPYSPRPVSFRPYLTLTRFFGVSLFSYLSAGLFFFRPRDAPLLIPLPLSLLSCLFFYARTHCHSYFQGCCLSTTNHPFSACQVLLNHSPSSSSPCFFGDNLFSLQALPTTSDSLLIDDLYFFSFVLFRNPLLLPSGPLVCTSARPFLGCGPKNPFPGISTFSYSLFAGREKRDQRSRLRLVSPVLLIAQSLNPISSSPAGSHCRCPVPAPWRRPPVTASTFYFLHQGWKVLQALELELIDVALASKSASLSFLPLCGEMRLSTYRPVTSKVPRASGFSLSSTAARVCSRKFQLSC